MKKSFWILGMIMAGIISLSGCSKEDSNMYGFIVENWKAKLAGFPKEDSYAFDKNKKVACVADQVTRDFIDGSVVTSDIKGLIKALTGKYPHYDSASVFTDVYLKTKSFEKANDAIWSYNQEKGLVPTDYLAKDLAGCTAAGVFEEGNILYWEFIDDSGITITDWQGNLKFKTPDEGPHSKEKNPYLEEILKQHGGFDNSEGRALLRSKYRNNPNEQFAYGVLTGETCAEDYIRKGKEKINQGDYVLLYTDGVGEIIFNGDSLDKDFISLLKQNNPSVLKRFFQKRVSSEGTLVVWRVE
jgi:hypothetical protein